MGGFRVICKISPKLIRVEQFTRKCYKREDVALHDFNGGMLIGGWDIFSREQIFFAQTNVVLLH